MLLVAVLVVAITGLLSIACAESSARTPTRLPTRVCPTSVPFNPKQVILEVFGAPGAVATINYLDVNAQPQQVVNAPLPWTFTITTTEPAVVGNVVAQGNGDTLGCRITINGEVKDERTVNKVDAYTFCLDKSG
jgi:Mycobacterium membrane protein